MMFKKCIVFTVLAINLLALSVSGHPATDTNDNVEIMETTTAKQGSIRGWISNIRNKIHEHGRNCNHIQGEGNVLNWVKNKFGWKKTSTVSPTTVTTGETDTVNQQPPTTVMDNGDDAMPEPEDGSNIETVYDNNERFETSSQNNEFAGSDSQDDTVVPSNENTVTFEPLIEPRLGI